jgi:GTPase SAR1 family protein
MYYRGSAAAVVVYDITNLKTFIEMQSWIQELRQLGPDNIVLAIAGNKLDITESRQVTRQKGEEYAQSVNALFAECSAKEDTNITDLFRRIAECIQLDKLGGTEIKPVTLKLNKTPSSERNCSC